MIKDASKAAPGEEVCQTPAECKAKRKAKQMGGAAAVSLDGIAFEALPPLSAAQTSVPALSMHSPTQRGNVPMVAAPNATRSESSSLESQTAPPVLD